MFRCVSKQYSIDDVVPGMEVGKAIIAENGQVLLSEGTVLLPYVIERLKQWNIMVVDILEKFDDNDAINAVVGPELKQQMFYEGYQITVREVKLAFERMRYFRQVPVTQMCELVDKSISSLVNSIGVINHLHIVQRQDEYTFHHSVNVAIIAGVLGKWLGYRDDQLRDLILAGLLHDIGKTQIPLEILNKPGKLTPVEMEVMRQHTVFGYYLVKEEKLPHSIIQAIFQHHERVDGSGYPMKISVDKIDPFARIIAVADIYDAMTTDRIYRNRMTPFVVLETLVEEMYDKLDPKVCVTFLNNVREFLIGNVVLLNDGREAEVLYLGQYTATRPVVRTADNEVIDLEINKDISIVSLL